MAPPAHSNRSNSYPKGAMTNTLTSARASPEQRLVVTAPCSKGGGSHTDAKDDASRALASPWSAAASMGRTRYAAPARYGP